MLNILRTTGLYTDLKFDLKNESRQIKEVLGFSKEIINNKAVYEESIAVFREALKGREEFTNSLINEKGKLFLDASTEYANVRMVQFGAKSEKFLSFSFRLPMGNIWQLILALISASIVLYMVFDFIRLSSNQSNIGIGFALLRVSALIIPSYFAYFFSRQYINGRKLYQFYKFKAVALSTLGNLYSLYPNEQQLIIEKALSVIFSEFIEGHDGEISQKDLIRIIPDLIRSSR